MPLKNTPRTVVLLFLALFIMGLSGLFISLEDINRSYEKKSHEINQMKKRLVKISSRYSQLKLKFEKNSQKWGRISFLEYKQNLFQKQYPLFSRIADVVYDESRIHKINPNLILGIIQVESNFNPYAKSEKEAYGLMQINYPVWKNELQIEKSKIYDIAYNIELGIHIFKQYYDQCERNTTAALHLYNNGFLYNNTDYPKKVNASIFCSKNNSWEEFHLSKPSAESLK